MSRREEGLETWRHEGLEFHGKSYSDFFKVGIQMKTLVYLNMSVNRDGVTSSQRAEHREDTDTEAAKRDSDIRV